MTNFNNEGIDKLLDIIKGSAKGLVILATTVKNIYMSTGDKRLTPIMDNLADVFLHLDQAAQHLYKLRQPEAIETSIASDLGFDPTEHDVEVKDTKVPYLKLIRTKITDDTQEQ